MAQKVHAVMAAIYLSVEQMEHVRSVAARFEQLNNIPVRIITGRDLPGVYLSYPHFARYHVWQIVPKDTEKIIYFDNDMIPLRPLPELPDVDFAAVSDRSKLVEGVSREYPIIKKAGQYFNAGFFVASPK